MKSIDATRRTFMAKTATGFIALPFLPLLPMRSEAQIVREDPTSDRAGSRQHDRIVNLNVRDFGAIGDGKTKDTSAIQQALDRCSVLGGGEVLVPAGDYLSGAIALRSNTVLRMDAGAVLLGSPDLADYPVTQVRWEGHWTQGYIGFISAMDAENIGITGKGRIVGNDAIRGRVDRVTGLRHPALMEFTQCKNVCVEDCVTSQNDMWSIHPTYCENITFRNVTVHGGADGIDVDSCKHVVIDGCTFATGDDCISLKSGRGQEGYSIRRPTEDVHIYNCTFSDIHWACIGIGSETSGGIRNIHVDHCKCIGAGTFAIYIKSRPGRGAFIEDIYMTNLEVSGARAGFLRINILSSGKEDAFSVAGDDGIPTLRNFRFSNIHISDLPMLVDAVNIHPHKPLDGLLLEDISGTCRNGMLLANIQHAVLRNIQVTGNADRMLSTYNVTGIGLEGATPLAAPNIPDSIPVPAQPYVLR